MNSPKARALLFAFFLLSAGAAHAASDVVISQIYGGGGNASATFQNDYIELFNRGSTPASLSGLSVQYASATGTGNFASNAVTQLSGTLQPGQYYLIALAGSTANGTPLPAFDASTPSLNIAAASGKVILVNGTAGLACNGGSAPCSAAQLSQIIDLVGYGAANFFDGAPTQQGSNTLSVIRNSGGCVDTDNNDSDFASGTPAPRNLASPLNPCSGGPINQPLVASCPTNLAVTLGTAGSADVSASDPDGFVSSAAITSTAIPGITLANVLPGNPLTAQLQVSNTVPVGNYPTTIRFSNNDTTPQTATCTIAVNVAPVLGSTRIHDIQGASHISPLNGQQVGGVPGIVTALRSNGFNFQDPTPDSNPATSEAVFVFTNSAPTVAVGDSVLVSGGVSEFRAGGADGLTNLTQTELVNPVVAMVSSANTLPAPILLGAGGGAIPSAVIDNDATGDVETSGTFDADTDAIDFFESLEAMRVTINNPVAVGPTTTNGEIAVLADNGASSTLRSVRGGILVAAGDFNPERVILDDAILPVPAVNVGDRFTAVTGVMDYSFGNFKLDITSPITRIDSGLTSESTNLVGTPSQLTVGSYNVENLAPNNPAAKFAALAGQIVDNLHSPDIVALMEMQDNNGTTNTGVVDATTTFNMLIAAIQAAGGPQYQFRSINPVNNEDGGAQGGNIRVGFLFNANRVSFVDRAGGDPLVATTVINSGSGAVLSASPGRIDPTNTAFANSRKPLAGEFLFNGRRVFVIANHFNSKLGDDPLFGHLQPPVNSSEIQRHQQATVVNTFVKGILAVEANASVVVLGDLNDFQFSDTVQILTSGNALVDTVDTLPPEQRYTYVFDGNSQVLDHILTSPALASCARLQLDILHVNAEFSPQTSDHDPDVIRVTLPKAGDVDGDGDVDRYDVDAIVAARNTNASGPYDSRNLNGDTRIDALDARLAVNACTRPACAVQ